MTPALKRNMTTALKCLKFECDYEDSQAGDSETFVLPNKLAPGIGSKTIETLLEQGLIEEGENRWLNKPGYRITEAGRTIIDRGSF